MQDVSCAYRRHAAESLFSGRVYVGEGRVLVPGAGAVQGASRRAAGARCPQSAVETRRDGTGRPYQEPQVRAVGSLPVLLPVVVACGDGGSTVVAVVMGRK